MIGIVFVGEVYICPFLQKYVDELERAHKEYEIISWDRSGTGGVPSDRHHVFTKKSAKMVNPIFKLKDFFDFGRYCRQIIRRKKYDKLIVLTTLSGIFLYRTLLKHYAGKYVFDYRDVSYERFGFFKRMVGKLVKHSAFTCVSSRGFLQYLPPDYPYIIAHNFKYSDVAKQETTYPKRNHSPIVVSYIGVLRESEYLEQLIDTFGGDERFYLYIHGGGDNEEALSKKAAAYDNVSCTGRYVGDEKIELIYQSDLLCYNYPCSFINNNALANKYYDGLIFKRPLFANIDTYSGKLVDKMGVGISLPYHDPKTTDRIYDYYQSLNEAEFLEKANRALYDVLEEDKIYQEAIREFVTN